jgi:hypothetical protein
MTRLVLTVVAIAFFSTAVSTANGPAAAKPAEAAKATPAEPDAADTPFGELFPYVLGGVIAVGIGAVGLVLFSSKRPSESRTLRDSQEAPLGTPRDPAPLDPVAASLRPSIDLAAPGTSGPPPLPEPPITPTPFLNSVGPLLGVLGLALLISLGYYYFQGLTAIDTKPFSQGYTMPVYTPHPAFQMPAWRPIEPPTIPQIQFQPPPIHQPVIPRMPTVRIR